jgi:hypothetical protein
MKRSYQVKADSVRDVVAVMRAERRRARIEAGMLDAMRSQRVPNARREASRRACRGAVREEGAERE